MSLQSKHCEVSWWVGLGELDLVGETLLAYAGTLPTSGGVQRFM